MEEAIGLLLAKTSARMRKNYADSLREVKLYVGQDHLLWQLWKKDGATQTELCELMGCEPPTLTNMLKKLEEYGLVTRKKDLSDARVTRVLLTDEGRALENPIMEIWRNHQKIMLKDISIEDQSTLKRLLLQIESNINK